ncbi:hypothetical protein LDENG_00285270 [Lucifuga dentata]|nr:hypothetical protein LDENG_00285270 [Lucifuga dentata]
MKQNRTRDGQRRAGEEKEGEKEEGEADGGTSSSRSSYEFSVPARSSRRMSLPCLATLSAMQLNRLHSSTQAPVTAKVLMHRSSSRRPSLQEAGPGAARRTSLTPTIPEVTPAAHEATKRRNAMSLSDADSVCLICHDDLSRGVSGTRELQCTHTFHRECIEEWLWRKQFCPTCHVQVSMPQPLYWNSTRVTVP